MSSIRSISASSILNSKGLPTIEVSVILASGARARAAAPTGQSRGQFERDVSHEKSLFSVDSALHLFEFSVAPSLLGRESSDLSSIDALLNTLHHNDQPIPSNVSLPVSMAILLAHCQEIKQSLPHYIGGIMTQKSHPTLCVNMINGAQHTGNAKLFQEYLIIPQHAQSVAQAISWSIQINYYLADILSKKGFSTAIGDEGGYAIDSEDALEPLEILSEAIHKAKLSNDVWLGVDCAASQYFQNQTYVDYPGCSGVSSGADIIKFFEKIQSQYPLFYIEDPFADNDISSWSSFDANAHIIGDDLFATAYDRLSELSAVSPANGLIIKPNQVGTVSQTLSTVTLARSLGYNTVFAHRSSDTEDTWIAELALGLQADFVKFGNIMRGERTAKYNTLLRFFER